jgi:hypothetical protein
MSQNIKILEHSRKKLIIIVNPDKNRLKAFVLDNKLAKKPYNYIDNNPYFV